MSIERIAEYPHSESGGGRYSALRALWHEMMRELDEPQDLSSSTRTGTLFCLDYAASEFVSPVGLIFTVSA